MQHISHNDNNNKSLATNSSSTKIISTTVVTEISLESLPGHPSQDSYEIEN